MMLAIFLGLVGTAFGSESTVSTSAGMYSDDQCSVPLVTDGGGLIDGACGLMTCDDSFLQVDGMTCDDSSEFCKVTYSVTVPTVFLDSSCCSMVSSMSDCVDVGSGLFSMTSSTGCDGVDTSEDACAQFMEGDGNGSGDSESGEDEPFVTEPIDEDQDPIQVTVVSFDSEESCDAGTDDVETEEMEFYMGCQTFKAEGATLSMEVACVEGEDKATRKVFLNGDCSDDPYETVTMENGGCTDMSEGDETIFEKISWTGFDCVTGEPEVEDEPENEPEDSDSSAAVLSLAAAFVVAFMH